MRIGCVYSVDDYNRETLSQPMATFSDIPFGISIIATILKQEGHDVDLFVVSRATNLPKILGDYITEKSPEMFCLTAVSSQFKMIEKVAEFINEADPDIYVVLGGHHASLAPENAIECPNVNAICVGEGDQAVIDLANHVATKTGPPSGISNLWIKDPRTGQIEKCPRNPYKEDLETLPHVDRSMWEPWIVNPEEEVSILVGRGCPYQCTYCSNHAMAILSPGKYVRYRAPWDMIDEIEGLTKQYPSLRNIYLEVETIGASMWDALELFEALADYNSQREERLNFRMNLAIHSSFVKNDEKVHEFLSYCQKANVVGLNVGLESGSERIRKIMKRPNYSNEEIIKFCSMAKEYGINMSLYVLMGLPDETPKDFMETVRVVREISPEIANLSIFWPYVGTDLFETARERGMIPPEGLEPEGERRRAILKLPEFPRWRLRFEYVVFSYRCYKGVWPLPKILARMVKSYIAPYPRLESVWRSLHNHLPVFASIKRKYSPRGRSGVLKVN